jgi:hypothetical protein
MKAVMTFGRLNPPTSGHQLLLDKVLSTAKKIDARPFLFVSHTQDKKKNPLSFAEKIKFISLGYPKISPFIVKDESIKTPFQALQHLANQGYKEIVVIVGEDRVQSFRAMILPYLNIADKSKSIDADSVKVISAGARDPDADDVTGMSASKLRSLASSGNFTEFSKGLMSGLKADAAKLMYNTLRKKINLQSEDFVLQSFLEFYKKEQKLDNRFLPKHTLEVGTDELVDAYAEMIPNSFERESIDVASSASDNASHFEARRK